jgi:hypothetical protein
VNELFEASRCAGPPTFLYQPMEIVTTAETLCLQACRHFVDLT